MCVWLGAGEWMSSLGMGFINPVGTGGELDVCDWVAVVYVGSG